MAAGLLAEALDELLLLSGAQATDAAVLGNADLLHGLLGGHLANAGKGDEDLQDLGLLGDLIVAVENLGERELAGLDIFLELGTLGASFLSLLECGSTLLISHLG